MRSLERGPRDEQDPVPTAILSGAPLFFQRLATIVTLCSKLRATKKRAALLVGPLRKSVRNKGISLR